MCKNGTDGGCPHKTAENCDCEARRAEIKGECGDKCGDKCGDACGSHDGEGSCKNCDSGKTDGQSGCCS